jgi:hypothetical protein
VRNDYFHNGGNWLPGYQMGKHCSGSHDSQSNMSQVEGIMHASEGKRAEADRRFWAGLPSVEVCTSDVNLGIMGG